jgi:hypothetical protein
VIHLERRVFVRQIIGIPYKANEKLPGLLGPVTVERAAQLLKLAAQKSAR